ncbi:MAG: ATPase, T2SS/T4P/T4SS family [Planctomycetota bacterium]
MRTSKKDTAQILAERGQISREQVKQAEKLAKGSGKKLEQTLVEAGFASDDQVASAVAERMGLEFVDLGKMTSDDVDLKLIPDDLIKKYLVIPLKKDNGKLHVIVHDPMDLELMDTLRFRLNAEVEPRLAPKSRIKEFLDSSAPKASMVAVADSDGKGKLVTQSIDSSVDRSLDKSIDVAGDDSPVVKLCNRILTEAVLQRVSDIHIEPMNDRVRLRYRVDGVCVERDNLPKRMQNAILSRVKLMASMNIAEKRVPQDGRIKLPVQDPNSSEVQQIDFRVSACPIYHGESVVLRILRPDAVRIGLTNIGFEEDNLEIFNKIIKRPNGIFLVTGPTGSGKTTTLYSALDVLNTPNRKIITAEDPVEYNFEGINQCQVREDIGLSFPSILRSMLRQAPNIILVGEIRDKEVGEIAIQAALTGHLVFSTLHTNDAPSAMTRLIDMGIKPFLVASSVQAVMAQRLIRILYDKTKVLADPEDLDPKHLKLVGLTMEEAVGKVYKAVSSQEAPGGYKGRRAIFELMQMSTELRDLTFQKAPAEKLREIALGAGMRPLVGDGRLKIMRGMTTPEEIARVTQEGH